MAELFQGHMLKNITGSLVEAEDLRNKVVALYFSGAWYSGAREFTLVLRDFYAALTEEHPPEPIQVVFVSLDRSSEEMWEYVWELHGDWLVVPWDDPIRKQLKERYNISAIPKLLIVKESGEVITDKGRTQVQEHGLAAFKSWLEATEIFQNFYI
uniref:nucleoredoxin-like protein 2 n=1 Tax=Myxine glutinosa TaxID=7769 RepID=UPI00358E571B